MALQPPRTSSVATGTGNTRAVPTGGILGKTRLCKFFTSSVRCPRGNACTFAHGEAELKPQPNLQKTRLCPEFDRHGTCRAGDACSFAHGREERRRIIVQRPPATSHGHGSRKAGRSSRAQQQEEEQPQRSHETQELKQQEEENSQQPRLQRQSQQSTTTARPIRGHADQPRPQQLQKQQQPETMPHTPRVADMRHVLEVEIEELRARWQTLKQAQGAQVVTRRPQACAVKLPIAKESGRADGAKPNAAASCVSTTHDVSASWRMTPSVDSFEGYSWADLLEEDEASSSKAESVHGYSLNSPLAKEAEHVDEIGTEYGAWLVCDVTVINTFVTVVPRSPTARRPRTRSAPPSGHEAAVGDERS